MRFLVFLAAVSLAACTASGSENPPKKKVEQQTGDPQTVDPQVAGFEVSLDEDTEIEIKLVPANREKLSGWEMRIDAMPESGTVTAEKANDGTLIARYRPAPNFHGADALSFSARVNGAWTDPATVSITVLPVNDAPAAFDAAIVTPFNRPVSGAVAGEDIEGAALTFAVEQEPLHGTLALQEDGTFFYTPEQDYEGDDSFTFIASDGELTSEPATVAITVLPPPPVLDSLSSWQLFGGDSLTITGSKFGSAPGTVRIGGIEAEITAWSDSSAEVVIPASLTVGFHKVFVESAIGAASGSLLLRVLEHDMWIQNVRPEAAAGHFAYWTGKEMIVIGGFDPAYYVAWRYDPARDIWTPLDTQLLSQSYTMRGVWTGKELLLWGGSYEEGSSNQGVRYDPATDTWSELPTDGAPPARANHSVVWTGKYMLVWGGIDEDYSATASGGAFDPETNQWFELPSEGAQPRFNHTAVWTGSEMIVYGGEGDGGIVGGGERLNLSEGTWSPLPATSAIGSRVEHTAVWTGQEMIVWGGKSCPFGCSENGGARFNPETGEWHPVSTVNAPGARESHAAVWTGEEMVIWGGQCQAACTGGGRYDPATDTWKTVADAGAPRTTYRPSMVLAEGEVIVFGGLVNYMPSSEFGRYDLAGDTWLNPGARSYHTAVWTGTELLLWGGSENLDQGFDTGMRYDPATNRWSPLSRMDAPAARYAHTAVWTGQKMVVWGGKAESYLDSGGMYDPVLDQWTAMSMAGAPHGREFHTAVWTGSEMIVWGGYNNGDWEQNSGGRFDPASNTWSTVTQNGAPSARYLHTAVWTGQAMIVFGGLTTEGTSNAGGIYWPHGDTWSTLPPAPLERFDHTAVWTGEEMIVWGGSGQFNGHRFQWASGTWEGMGVPPHRFGRSEIVRREFCSVWTGEEMIVISYPEERIGGRYNPVTNTWISLPAAGAPAPDLYGFNGFTCSWTGKELLLFVKGLYRYVP